jgi:hypothetical protein
VQSNLYEEVSFGTKTKWPYKTGDLLKEVDFALDDNLQKIKFVSIDDDRR